MYVWWRCKRPRMLVYGEPMLAVQVDILMQARHVQVRGLMRQLASNHASSLVMARCGQSHHTGLLRCRYNSSKATALHGS